MLAGHPGAPAAPKGPAKGSFVEHQWNAQSPVFARAMCMAKDTVFVSGPPDMIDEEYAFERRSQKDPAIYKDLAAQDAALDGKSGGSIFRSALDRWPADPYVLEVSASAAKDESVARFLRNFTDPTPLNLVSARLKEEGASRLLFPHAAPGSAPAWSGALDAGSLPQLTDSPARAEVLRRILDGEVGVWVLVGSGERVADEQAAAVLEKRLFALVFGRGRVLGAWPAQGVRR